MRILMLEKFVNIFIKITWIKAIVTIRIHKWIQCTHLAREVIRRAKRYRKPLSLEFIDFEKYRIFQVYAYFLNNNHNGIKVLELGNYKKSEILIRHLVMFAVIFFHIQLQSNILSVRKVSYLVHSEREALFFWRGVYQYGDQITPPLW